MAIDDEIPVKWDPFDVTFKLTSHSVEETFIHQASQTYADIIESLKITLMNPDVVDKEEWTALMIKMIVSHNELQEQEKQRKQGSAAKPKPKNTNSAHQAFMDSI